MQMIYKLATTSYFQLHNAVLGNTCTPASMLPLVGQIDSAGRVAIRTLSRGRRGSTFTSTCQVLFGTLVIFTLRFPSRQERKMKLEIRN